MRTASWWAPVVLAGLVLVWVLVLVVCYVAARRADKPTRLRDALRLPHDVVRLVRRPACTPPCRGACGGAWDCRWMTSDGVRGTP